MGVDAAWVCFTCETVYSPGYRGVLSREFEEKVNRGEVDPDELRELAEKIESIFIDYKWGSDVLTAARMLKDLANWMEKHKGHKIYVTNEGTYNTAGFTAKFLFMGYVALFVSIGLYFILYQTHTLL